MCVAGSIGLAIALPRFWSYDARDEVAAQELTLV
jgi:hypothetical protein